MSLDTVEVYIVIGSEPGEQSKPLEIFLEREDADSYLFNGLVQSMAMHKAVVTPGCTASLLMTRGDEINMTSGSFVVNGEDRHVWDFRVEKRWASRP